MKAVILAGEFGARSSEETDVRPKSMIEIGGNPVLWHIMCPLEAAVVFWLCDLLPPPNAAHSGGGFLRPIQSLELNLSLQQHH